MITLIIDSSYLCYSSMYSIRDLSSKDQQTGVLFGFLNTILSLSKRFKTNDFVFCFDSKRSVRKRIYPDYKENRKDYEPEIQRLIEVMRPQRELLQKEILPSIGFSNILMQSGYEADDIIAHLVIGFREDFVVVSRDSDLYQLLDYCRIYDIPTKTFLTKDSFKLTRGLTPKQWIQIKAIAGCPSDNIKGIDGFGEITARKYILGFMKETDKKYQRIFQHENMEKIQLNLRLVSLPMEGSLPIEEIRANCFDVDRFIDICQKYNFRSFLNEKLDQWKKLLNGEENE
jgi:DNA polymerase I